MRPSEVNDVSCLVVRVTRYIEGIRCRILLSDGYCARVHFNTFAEDVNSTFLDIISSFAGNDPNRNYSFRLRTVAPHFAAPQPGIVKCPLQVTSRSTLADVTPSITGLNRAQDGVADLGGGRRICQHVPQPLLADDVTQCFLLTSPFLLAGLVGAQDGVADLGGGWRFHRHVPEHVQQRVPSSALADLTQFSC